MNYKIFIFVFFILYLFLQLENKKSEMLNIYNQPLQRCGEKNMNNGSWDNLKKCSEIDGGVHQICINNISSNATNFSKLTGQSDWSSNRNNENHCVCLGAWSLYVAQKKKNGQNIKQNILKCDAIPKVSLSKKYISKFSSGWNKWNGLEIDGQIKDGVNELVTNCFKGQYKEEFKKNYCQFAKKVPELTKTNAYLQLCK